MSSIPVLSIETAPDSSQRHLERARAAFGFVPNVLGMLANAPAALETYLTVMGIFQRSSLTPVEQQVVLLAVSGQNGCGYCTAAHTTIASGAGVPEAVIGAIRTGQPVPDPRLEALRCFAVMVVRDRGWAPAALTRFLAAGYSPANALEVLVGVSLKTLSNYANHLAGTPIDAAFAGAAWTETELVRQSSACQSP